MENIAVAPELKVFRYAIEMYGVKDHWLMAASVTLLLPGLIVSRLIRKTFAQRVVLRDIKG